MKAKKFIFNLSAPVKIIAAAFFILSLSACFSPWDGSGGEGTLTFNFGGANGSARGVYVEADEYLNFSHKVILWNSANKIAAEQEFFGSGGTISVPAGTYTVTIKGYGKNDTDENVKLRSYGITEENVHVKSGQNAPVTVNMKSAAEVGSWQELMDIFTEVNSFGDTSLTKASEFYVIINKDLMVGITDEDETVNNNNSKITLISEQPIKIDASKSVGKIFSIGPNASGAVLTLGIKNMTGTITITGSNTGTSNTPLITVSRGTLVMNDRVSIINHNNTGNDTDNDAGNGGAVFIGEGGTFEMYGGEISGNTANYGGGVFVSRGNFYKHRTGGEIFDNTAKEGQAVYATNDDLKDIVFNFRDADVLKHEELSCLFIGDNYRFEGKWELVPVTGVTLDNTSLVLAVNDIRILTASIIPDNAANKNVTWTSSDEGVARVTVEGETSPNTAGLNAVVTAVSDGTTTITVTTADGKHFAACYIIVTTGIAADPNAGTDGTEGNPFIVWSADTLLAVGRGDANNDEKYNKWTLAAHYKQTANITLPENHEWTTIGIYKNTDINLAFSGTYDGDGHTITNLTITSDNTNNGCGMFGSNRGTIKNLGLANVNITTTGNGVGGIAGYNNTETIIENCYVTGSIIGDSFVGGIVGQNLGTVKECYVTGTGITAKDEAGGIVGYNNGGSIINCYSTINVTGEFAGGIAGEHNNGLIQYCYATGDISGISSSSSNIGGIVGLKGGETAMIENCVALNKDLSNAPNDNYGRIIGSTASGMNYNYGRIDMTFNNSPGGEDFWGSNTTMKNGANVSEGDCNTSLFWGTTVNFQQDFWTFHNGLPTLTNTGGTQNPQVND